MRAVPSKTGWRQGSGGTGQRRIAFIELAMGVGGLLRAFSNCVTTCNVNTHTQPSFQDKLFASSAHVERFRVLHKSKTQGFFW